MKKEKKKSCAKKRKAAPRKKRHDPKDTDGEKRSQAIFAGKIGSLVIEPSEKEISKKTPFMNKSKIKDRLEKGCGATVRSKPFCLNELRNMAKAAMRGNTTLTVVVEDELTDTDIKSILNEAPTHVHFDYTHCVFEL